MHLTLPKQGDAKHPSVDLNLFCVLKNFLIEMSILYCILKLSNHKRKLTYWAISLVAVFSFIIISRTRFSSVPRLWIVTLSSSALETDTARFTTSWKGWPFWPVSVDCLLTRIFSCSNFRFWYIRSKLLTKLFTKVACSYNDIKVFKTFNDRKTFLSWYIFFALAIWSYSKCIKYNTDSVSDKNTKNEKYNEKNLILKTFKYAL